MTQPTESKQLSYLIAENVLSEFLIMLLLMVMMIMMMMMVMMQLILTFMLTSIVVYLYTVLAFNFFRKFYVQEEEGEEPDSKCHDMLSVCKVK